MEIQRYAIKVKAQPLPLFETPVGFGEISNAESLLDDLATAIKANKAASSGIKRSNEGGWHSNTDMLEWGGDAARKVADIAISIAKRMSHFEEASVDDFDWKVSIWANVTAPRGLNALHSHPGNLWAAVLYIGMRGGPESGIHPGVNFYLKPTLSAGSDAQHRLKGGRWLQLASKISGYLTFKRGNLVVSRARLRHGVRPYTGSRERISVAIKIDALPRR